MKDNGSKNIFTGNADNPINTYALVIGIADYKNMEHYNGDLNYTAKDAELFYNFLKEQKFGKIQEDALVLLTDSSANKENIIDQMQRLYEKADDNDRLILFYSGHGGHRMFLPYDYSKKDKNTHLFHSEIKKIFKNSPARK